MTSYNKDLRNKRIGNVTVLERVDNKAVKVLGIGHEWIEPPTWLCRCDCGNTWRVQQKKITDFYPKLCPSCAQSLTNSNRKNIIRNRWVNQYTHPSYNSWKAMMARCYNPNHVAYDRYGGRGITVCKRWRTSFDEFVKDMGIRPPNKSIDRINNNRGYSKSNCKWSTAIEQSRNRRNVRNR